MLYLTVHCYSYAYLFTVILMLYLSVHCYSYVLLICSLLFLCYTYLFTVILMLYLSVHCYLRSVSFSVLMVRTEIREQNDTSVWANRVTYVASVVLT